MNNGSTIDLAGARIITPPTKFEFNETTIRNLQDQVKRYAASQSGVPIADPCGFLTMCVILDKMNDIGERLAKLESKP